MSEATLKKYQLQLSLIGHQYTSSEPYIPQSGRYADISLQSLLSHTTPDNENPLHCKMNQPIEMVYTQSGYISSS